MLERDRNILPSMHRRADQLRRLLAYVPVRIAAQHPDRDRDDVVLTGSAFAFFAALARESMQRPTPNRRIRMRKVLQELGDAALVEVVVEHDAASDANGRAGMREPRAKGRHGALAGFHELLPRRPRSMRDGKFLDEVREPIHAPERTRARCDPP